MTGSAPHVFLCATGAGAQLGFKAAQDRRVYREALQDGAAGIVAQWWPLAVYKCPAACWLILLSQWVQFLCVSCLITSLRGPQVRQAIEFALGEDAMDAARGSAGGSRGSGAPEGLPRGRAANYSSSAGSRAAGGARRRSAAVASITAAADEEDA